MNAGAARRQMATLCGKQVDHHRRTRWKASWLSVESDADL